MADILAIISGGADVVIIGFAYFLFKIERRLLRLEINSGILKDDRSECRS
ncbi:hypothetical protein [Pseudemcibacter aquimaris]|nr:hypothetical protein [Pseudemcibacter aquimaris]MCC3859778.1 hypothetical protein [Pseudemcibacter aquimaris]WDU60172.1 hypothetical protein KW060_07865 [Pseudemcibacter aquimaris]